MDAEALATFLMARLTSKRAEADWRDLIERTWARWLDEPIATFTGPALTAWVHAHLEEDRIVEVIRPAIRFAVVNAVVEARTDDQPLSRWVPDDAQKEIEAIAERKGLVDPAWVEHVFAQKAMEEVVTDTLYKALKDFSTILPRLVTSMTPSALGKLTKLGGRVVDGVEKRIEPEIKKWLDKGGRRALDGAARFTIDHLDDPVSIEGRRNTVRFALSRSPAFHVAKVDDATLDAVDRIAESIARRIAKEEDSRAVADRIIDRVRDAGTLSAWLASIGITKTPDFDAWANMMWPWVRLGLEAAEPLIQNVSREALKEPKQSADS